MFLETRPPLLPQKESSLAGGGLRPPRGSAPRPPTLHTQVQVRVTSAELLSFFGCQFSPSQAGLTGVNPG